MSVYLESAHSGVAGTNREVAAAYINQEDAEKINVALDAAFAGAALAGAEPVKLKFWENPIPCKKCIPCKAGYPRSCAVSRRPLRTLDEVAWFLALSPCMSDADRRRWAGFEASDPPQSVPYRPRPGSGEPESLFALASLP